jgi:predicted AAA+ superfamily ATPase
MSTERAHLIELDQLAREEGRRFGKQRDLAGRVRLERGRHFIGIVGPRGVGKTVLLKQIAAEHERSFYISLDTLEEPDLFGLIRGMHDDHGVDLFLLDEAHSRQDIDGVLKKVFDFLEVRVVFTGSVALSILESVHDLSRRVRILHLLPFTFREYLDFKHDMSLPRLGLADIENRTWSTGHMRALVHFEAYLRGGLMPFALDEPDVLPLLVNILEKILARDIPSVARVALQEVAIMDRLVRFIGRSEVDGINYSSLARNLGITKYKAEAYVSLLERAFVLHRVLPRGANVTREPKILMSLPYRLLHREYDEALGGLREDFFAEVMRAAGLRYSYLKSRRGAKTPDYIVDTEQGDMVVEVGGRGKGRSQFKGIDARKRIVFSHSDSTRGINRPLHLLGFLGGAF